jgi:hypothetical protein
MRKLVLVPILLAISLAACDRGGTPAQEQAAKDSAASVAPASDLPATSPPVTAAAVDTTTAGAPAPGDSTTSAPAACDHGNAAAYASCMQKAARARSADERSVLEGTCAASKPH